MKQTLFDDDGRMVKSADVSDDGRYRWTLSRTWDRTLPRLGWVMCNPSTADAHFDDPTVRRCIGFARRDGYGGIDVVNLFAWRTAHVYELIDADRRGDDIVGEPKNRWPTRNLHVHRVVAAWGAGPVNRWPDRVGRVANVVPERGWWCLGRTANGQPRHPLYVRASQPLERWSEG